MHLGWQDAILTYILSVVRLLILDRQIFGGKKTSVVHAYIRKQGKVDSKYYIDETKYEPGNSLSECMISPNITNHLLRNFLFHTVLFSVNVRWLSFMRTWISKAVFL